MRFTLIGIFDKIDNPELNFSCTSFTSVSLNPNVHDIPCVKSSYSPLSADCLPELSAVIKS